MDLGGPFDFLARTQSWNALIHEDCSIFSACIFSAFEEVQPQGVTRSAR